MRKTICRLPANGVVLSLTPIEPPAIAVPSVISAISNYKALLWSNHESWGYSFENRNISFVAPTWFNQRHMQNLILVQTQKLCEFVLCILTNQNEVNYMAISESYAMCSRGCLTRCLLAIQIGRSPPVDARSSLTF